MYSFKKVEPPKVKKKQINFVVDYIDNSRENFDNISGIDVSNGAFVFDDYSSNIRKIVRIPMCNVLKATEIYKIKRG